jgi:hypothetical protein
LPDSVRRGFQIGMKPTATSPITTTAIAMRAWGQWGMSESGNPECDGPLAIRTDLPSLPT